MEEEKKDPEIKDPEAPYIWRFKTLIQDPITKQWNNGVCYHNVVLNPICTIKTCYIKDDSSPTKVSKIVFNDGDYIYCRDKPSCIIKNLGIATFDVN